jgi:hypothetical protein
VKIFFATPNNVRRTSKIFVHKLYAVSSIPARRLFCVRNFIGKISVFGLADLSGSRFALCRSDRRFY